MHIHRKEHSLGEKVKVNMQKNFFFNFVFFMQNATLRSFISTSPYFSQIQTKQEKSKKDESTSSSESDEIHP